MSSRISLDIGINNLFVIFIIRALGTAMAQLPLINQAVAGLHPKDYATGIGMNNMIRQLGGAFGIAVANNYIAKHYAQNRSDIVSTMQNGMQQATVIGQGITAKTGDIAEIANTKALAIMSSGVDRQAYYLAYLDTFRMIGIFFLVVLPFIFFLRTKKKSAEEIATAAKAAAEAH
jgi:DHA2 family multidrug resistance protein